MIDFEVRLTCEMILRKSKKFNFQWNSSSAAELSAWNQLMVNQSVGRSVYTHLELFGLLANLGAITLVKLICFSGGGPPFGIPRIITESPDRTLW